MTQATTSQIEQALAILATEPNFSQADLVKITTSFEQLAGLLHGAVQQLGMDLTAKQYWQLLKYLDTLLMWNKAYNLTAITQPVEALIKHIIDCMAIIPAFKELGLPITDLLDIGTGAGLPSVIVAICEPNRVITPLDSNQKRIRFIRQVVSELGLKNVKPVASRIEDFSGSFELITSRAFASLDDFINLAEPYVSQTGYLAAMKGKAPTEEELVRLAQVWELEVKELTVPYLSDSRHLVKLKKR